MRCDYQPGGTGSVIEISRRIADELVSRVVVCPDLVCPCLSPLSAPSPFRNERAHQNQVQLVDICDGLVAILRWDHHQPDGPPDPS